MEAAKALEIILVFCDYFDLFSLKNDSMHYNNSKGITMSRNGRKLAHSYGTLKDYIFP